MKSYLCVVGIFCALALVKGEPPSELKKIFEECAKEIGMPESEESAKESPNFDDPKVKCLNACTMKKKGGLVDGKIVTEKTIEFISKYSLGEATDALKKDVNECASKANEGKDECEVGGEFYKCMMQTHPIHF
ncbi:general odorant-binding protein 56d-like [Phymastichus coffea]|uniref:general odorant-binding protein 56d-like n=1 Tax=Phymastichus coffea TaxID=108790 RepID=UPI00273C8F98|nr:general odorant-binding protein 56d-like [Phymastichus coffea]